MLLAVLFLFRVHSDVPSSTLETVIKSWERPNSYFQIPLHKMKCNTCLSCQIASLALALRCFFSVCSLCFWNVFISEMLKVYIKNCIEYSMRCYVCAHAIFFSFPFIFAEIVSSGTLRQKIKKNLIKNTSKLNWQLLLSIDHGCMEFISLSGNVCVESDTKTFCT